jgi:hypothetical protein
LNAKPNEYNNNLIKLAVQISEELNNIHNNIVFKENSQRTYCTNLRGLLQKYQDNYHKTVSKIEKINWIRSQSEPLDFIKMFNIIFNVPNNVNYKQESWGTNSKGKKIVLKSMTKLNDTIISTNYVDIIDIDTLMKGDVYVKDLFPKRIIDTIFDDNNLWKPDGDNGATFSRRYEKRTYINMPLLYLHINRLTPDSKLDTQVIPVLKIKSTNMLIYLRSIIVHHGGKNGGHYTCLYECNNNWFIYDDMNTNTQEIGSFDKVLSHKDGYYLKNCTDIVYW